MHTVIISRVQVDTNGGLCRLIQSFVGSFVRCCLVYIYGKFSLKFYGKKLDFSEECIISSLPFPPS